jgi:acetyl-CoA C-acetyltransferase
MKRGTEHQFRDAQMALGFGGIPGIGQGVGDRAVRSAQSQNSVLIGSPVKSVSLAGLGLSDFDYYEIHEAFAAQVLCTLAAWEDPGFCREKLGRDEPLGAIDRERLNVNGGSLAAAHPFAATGGRIVAGLAKQLHEDGKGRGVVSICAAGGQGVVAILEGPEGAR